MTYVVTGCSRGIGKAVAKALLDAGDSVLGTSRSSLGRFSHDKLEWLDLDVLSKESVERFCTEIHGMSDLQGLVNNAGINIIEEVVDLSRPSLEKVLLANLESQLVISASVARMLKAQRSGRLVNIASIWSEVGKPGRMAYAASKAGLVGATRVMALELAPFNVLVNAVSPGFTQTDLTKSTMGVEGVKNISDQIPFGRLALPEEIASVVYFLISDKNTYLTGQNIVVDGGFSIA